MGRGWLYTCRERPAKRTLWRHLVRYYWKNLASKCGSFRTPLHANAFRNAGRKSVRARQRLGRGFMGDMGMRHDGWAAGALGGFLMFGPAPREISNDVYHERRVV